MYFTSEVSSFSSSVTGIVNINTNNIVPITLKVKCIVAALFAFFDAPKLDKSDVTHVPILSPYNIGNAALSGNIPCDARAISIPIDALDDWTIPVIAKPASIPNNGCTLTKIKACLNCGKSANGFTASFINSIPVNNIPNPSKISAYCLYFWFLAAKYIIIPIPNAIGAIFSNLKDTNWAVTVVPILAPIMIPIAWDSDIIPAFTKPTTITVVALELWIIPVTTAPTKTPITTLLVRNPIIFFNCSPADFWSPSPIIFMPYKNNPNPPNKLIAICTFAPP